MTRSLIPRLIVHQLEPSLYEYHLVFADEELAHDAGFQSIRETLESAADITGDIRAVELAYEGLVVGTYPLHALRTSAETIAAQAVDTAAALRDF